MKSLFEEYGKVVFFIIAILILISYIFSSSPGGFLHALGQFNPNAYVGSDSNAEKLKRTPPVLEVDAEKLTAGTAYDLLSFVTEAHTVEDNEDTPVTQLAPTVVKIIDASGNELPLPTLENGKLMYTFERLEQQDDEEILLTSYRVTYEVVDYFYSDYPVKTTKTYQFVVN